LGEAFSPSITSSVVFTLPPLHFAIAVSIQKQAGLVAGALVTAFNQLHIFWKIKFLLAEVKQSPFRRQPRRPSTGYYEQLYENPS
jgi:hypothetical protein